MTIWLISWEEMCGFTSVFSATKPLPKMFWLNFYQGQRAEAASLTGHHQRATSVKHLTWRHHRRTTLPIAARGMWHAHTHVTNASGQCHALVKRALETSWKHSWPTPDKGSCPNMLILQKATLVWAGEPCSHQTELSRSSYMDRLTEEGWNRTLFLSACHPSPHLYIEFTEVCMCWSFSTQQHVAFCVLSLEGDKWVWSTFLFHHIFLEIIKIHSVNS